MVKNSFELPEGWQVVKIKRRKGFSRGKVDKHYFSPSGEHFRSLIAVQRFLKAEPPAEQKADVIVIVDSSDDEVIVIEESSSPWI